MEEEVRVSRLGAGRINKRGAPPSHLEHLYFAAGRDASHRPFLTMLANKKKRQGAEEGKMRGAGEPPSSPFVTRYGCSSLTFSHDISDRSVCF